MAHEALLRSLNGSERGRQWADYLKSAEVRRQLRLGEAASVPVLTDVLKRYEKATGMLPNGRLPSVRLALRHFTAAASIPTFRQLPSLARATTEQLQPASDPAAGQQIGRQLEYLAVRLEKYAKTPRPSTLRYITAGVEWLESQGQAADVCAAVRRHLGLPPAVGASPRPATARGGIPWVYSYEEAVRIAKAERKELLIFFHNRGADDARDAFELRTLPRVANASRVGRYVWARLGVDTRVQHRGREVTLLEHPAFAHCGRRQGIAVVDYRQGNHPGRLVGAFPFSRGQYYGTKSLATILDLPAGGTVTQKTMIYAVRMHGEAPQSAAGRPHSALLQAAFEHSSYQAQVQVQGHQNFDARFGQIQASTGGFAGQEVVAESWPNQSLLEAALECVSNWRSSPGHWSAVVRRHAAYGYDIQRGANGVWYATGMFAD